MFGVVIAILMMSAYSCVEEVDKGSIYPPDWVDPNAQDTTSSGGNDTTLNYIYTMPEVDANGRILVKGRPPQYTDTAKHHVLAVAYDITSSKPIDLTTYYASAVGKSGDKLREALVKIISNNFVGVSYGDARYVLQDADKDPLDDTKVWCFYEENTASRTWDNGVSWNREHVWAVSKGLGERPDNMAISTATDLYNLKAELESINTAKGNRDFEEKDGNADFYGTHGTYSYAPKKSARGDVARILFYMELRWHDAKGIYLDEGSSASTSSPRQGVLSDLIKWHSADPVDPFEIRRSNVVYSKQKNRNPFVDHPELVDYLYGDLKDKAWDGGVTYKNNN